MKKRTFLATAFMGLALVACDSDELIDNKGIDKNEGNGVPVTLKLNIASPLTKGNPGATNDQNGTESENAINSLMVVIDYGTAGKVIREVSDLTGETASSPYSTVKTFTLQDVPVGTATFYVYANVPESDKSAIKSNWTSTLSSASESADAYFTVADGESNTAANFFMSSLTNEDGSVKNATVSINPDNENSITLDIERAAVKVTAECGNEVFSDEAGVGGTASDLHFKLRNTVNKFSLLANNNGWNFTDNIDDNKTAEASTQIDFSKSAYGQDGAASEDRLDLPALYTLENLYDASSTSTTPTPAAAEEGTPKGNTFVNFKTTFTPGSFPTISSVSTPGGGEDSFTASVPTTPEEGEVTTEGSTTATGAATFFVVRGIAEGTEYNNLLTKYIKESDLYENGEAKTGLTITQDTEGKNANWYTVEGLKGITKIEKYENGECWFGPVYANDTEGNHKTYRNDWYHLKVTSIQLPGSSVEPEEEVEQANITVTCRLMMWNWVDREVELGGTTVPEE